MCILIQRCTDKMLLYIDVYGKHVANCVLVLCVRGLLFELSPVLTYSNSVKHILLHGHQQQLFTTTRGDPSLMIEMKKKRFRFKTYLHILNFV